ncbi:P-loop containing nucleoside triphosphate hydrolases superfamily protein [Carex rostrata]
MVLLSLQPKLFPLNFPSSRSNQSINNKRKPNSLLVGTQKRLKPDYRRFSASSLSPHGGFLIVEDDLPALLQILPRELQEQLENEPKKAELLEVVLDLGRRPEARFLSEPGGQYLRNTEVSQEELQEAERAIGEFGGDNRAGIEGTLHRISAIRSRKGTVVGLTCRVGRAVTGHVDMVRDLLEYKESILFLGRPGVGKTTVMREIARVLADELHKRVVIVDTSNEIGGDGDVPHSAIGGARRMQVPEPSLQHNVMIEAVENHMPEVIIVDEIGTKAEAVACRSIAERGVMLIGTAHGERLGNIVKNPTLSDLVGGVEAVTLSDEEARARRTQKTIMERKAPPTFPFLIEMRERDYWVTHRTEKSVDTLLHGRKPFVEIRRRDEKFNVVIDRWTPYDGDGI